MPTKSKLSFLFYFQLSCAFQSWTKLGWKQKGNFSSASLSTLDNLLVVCLKFIRNWVIDVIDVINFIVFHIFRLRHVKWSEGSHQIKTRLVWKICFQSFCQMYDTCTISTEKCHHTTFFISTKHRKSVPMLAIGSAWCGSSSGWSTVSLHHIEIVKIEYYFDVQWAESIHPKTLSFHIFTFIDMYRVPYEKMQGFLCIHMYALFSMLLMNLLLQWLQFLNLLSD